MGSFFKLFDLWFGNFTDQLGNIRLSYQDANGDGSITVSTDPNVTEIVEENNYYPFGLKHKGYNSVANGAEHPYKYNGKEFNEELGLDWYDYGARNYDPSLGRWMNIDPFADAYTSISPYTYVLNNPIFYVDPDGRQIEISGVYEKDKHGRDVLDENGNKKLIGVNITVTGKLLNESGKAFTDEQLASFADRLSDAIEESFSSASEAGFEVNVQANITVATEDNKLTGTDHAFTIVDRGKIPDPENAGEFRSSETVGTASFGEFGVYIIADIINEIDVPASTGNYANTGKTIMGDATLERTGSHETGHSATLNHPARSTMDGNLMHQSRRSNAGMKVTKAQILEMKKAYDTKQLNKGRQNYNFSSNILVGPRKSNGSF